MARVTNMLILIILLSFHVRYAMNQDLSRRVGRMQEVFAWTQLTYNIDGNPVLRDASDIGDLESESTQNNGRRKRQMDSVVFGDNDGDEEDGRRGSTSRRSRHDDSENRSAVQRPWQQEQNDFNSNMYQLLVGSMDKRPNANQMNLRRIMQQRPDDSSAASMATTTAPNDISQRSRFFIQYNNVPMGVERHQNRLFVTVPRRRYGIPATLNYLDLNQDSRSRSPGLRPYPDLRRSRSLVSVYRTRVDECGRLWMVDTGRLEIPNEQQQIQPPAIVVFDLATDRQLFRYEFKDSDLRGETTPAGLASITVDISDDRCDDAYAYVPDLATYGIIVYSLRENDSWRLSHNFFSFNPTAGNLNIGGQRFQWSDGIFSIALSDANGRNCRTAYFHPLISTQEFSVSTCDLKNRSFANDSNAWERYSLVGERGADTQSTTHGYHPQSRVMFFAEVGRNAVSCWHTGRPLVPANVVVLAQDSQTVQYPSDLHVTGDEVWVMANSMPRFSYARLDVAEYNFYIYRGNVSDMIAGTVCEPPLSTGK